MSNFALLSSTWPVLADLGELAEKNLHHDPNTSLIKLRMFAEVMTKYLFAYEKLNEPVEGTQIARLNVMGNAGIIPDIILPPFHSLRRVGNKATHEAFGTFDSARTHLHLAHRLAVWFRETYGTGDFTPLDFVEPEKNDQDPQQLAALNQELAERSADLEQKCTLLQSALDNLKTQETTSEQKTKRRKASAHSVSNLHLTEAETRLLIDEQLNAAGWLADTQNLRYAKGARPEKGENKAIAEWPTSSGPADYALFAGMQLVGVAEAKKRERDVVSDLGQSKRYSRDVQPKGEELFVGGPWGEYKVPFLFASNSRPYLIRIRPDQAKIYPEYLNLTMASYDVRTQIEIPARSTSGVNNINSDELRALSFNLPPSPNNTKSSAASKPSSPLPTASKPATPPPAGRLTS